MRRAPFVLAAICTVAACRADQTRLASAGTLPAGIHLIGPQPGTDRLIPEATNPYGADRTMLDDGRRLFVWFNCSGCHGDHAGGGMGPSLRDSTWLYGGSDEAIFSSITQGRANGMPAWGAKLPEDQVWRIVAYIKSLRTPDEPDPPR